MEQTKADLLSQLQRDILPLQGYKHLSSSKAVDVDLGIIEQAFPNRTFPLAATHEFFCHNRGEAAASYGFVTGILSSLMRNAGPSVWIGNVRNVFAPALKRFGIDPHKILFVPLQKEKDILWVLEEALKCESLIAVVGDVQEISFTASRRFQLAVEESGVNGFFIRRNPRNLSTACLTRWNIQPLLTQTKLPGLGFPKWNVQLLKVRNGKPGSWQMEWKDGTFQLVHKTVSLVHELQRKTG
jgi:protein ImuA